MHNTRPFLGPALAISLALHAALVSVRLPEIAGLQVPKPLRELIVHLPAPEKPAAAPRLTLPPEPQPNASASAPLAAAKPRPAAPRVAIPQPASADPQRLQGEAALRAAEQLARDLPYPPEAIERGLQGEALVLIFLDRSGNAIAARLEASSGHAILDDAAVRAARQLRALPDSAPREALLPVRFRLR
ncbi:MAG: energy transducer TonB [Burkholderiales bacterium]